jgi:hypothetical protein
MGRYQVPISYSWADEIAAGALGPEVPNGQRNGAPNGAPQPSPGEPQVA